MMLHHVALWEGVYLQTRLCFNVKQVCILLSFKGVKHRSAAALKDDAVSCFLPVEPPDVNTSFLYRRFNSHRLNRHPSRVSVQVDF